MTLTAISDTVFSYARTINNTLQTVPYAGRAWVYARDNIVLPGAAVAVALWSAVASRINHAANWVLPSIAVGVTAVGLLVMMALHRRRRFMTHVPQQQELTKKEKALEDQTKEVERLRSEWDKARNSDQTIPANKIAAQQAEAALYAAQQKKNALYWEWQAAKRKAGTI